MPEEIIAISEVDVADGIRAYDVRELEGTKLAAFCSVKAETMAEKALVFNAANNPQHKVNDFINKKIMLKDVYAETLELCNAETGEYEKAPRIVLIDENGEAYECVSVGMFSSLKKLIATFGEPTWEDPIPVVVKQEKVKNGSMLTLTVQL
jgi:hypothetical protein